MTTIKTSPALAAGLFALLAATPAVQAAPAQTTPFIHVDQFGYLPAARKVAIVADPQAGANAAQSFSPGTGANQYQVRRWSDDAVLFSGTLQSWQSGATHGQSGDRGWWFDFSPVQAAGAYYLYDTQRQVGSGRFSIGATAYNGVLRQALRTFYYQRLGIAHPKKYAGARWTDTAAYQGANQDRYATSRYAKGDPATAKNLRGGWMDAGDTNKYTTFAQDAVLALLEAYRLTPAVFTDALNIPESGNGVADLLDEVRWELDFLKRMQDATGTNGFLLKVGLDTYTGSASPPSSDTRPRYYVPECTSATLAGAAMFASAAVVYRGVPSQVSYGDNLLTRAERAWRRAKTTTNGFASYQTNCDDGDIKAGDADVDAQGQLESAFIAAVYLYEATGKTEYRDFVESRYTQVQPYSTGWWGPYWHSQQVALLRYSQLPGVSATVAANIRNQKAAQNGVMSVNDLQATTDLYRAYLPDGQYHWGHNRVRAVAGSMNLDFATYGINPTQAPAYREVAEQHLHWLHGANPLGLAMLSNMGAYGAESSINELYHAWFDNGTAWDNALTSPKGPAPGYLTGGPNTAYSGDQPGIRDQPPQKAYRDWNTGWPENSWELSEPSIYGQADYILLLSRLMTSTPLDQTPPSAPGVPVASNIGSNGITLTWTAASDDQGVLGYDLYNGETLLRAGLSGTRALLDGLACGTAFSLKLKAYDAAGNSSTFSPVASVKTAACTQVVNAYTDALGANWSDWSWGSTRNFANASPHKVGSYSARIDYTDWGGLSLRRATAVDTPAGTQLSLWVYSPTAVPLSLYTQATDSGAASTAVNFTTSPGVWQQVNVSMAQLSSPATIQRINVQLNTTGSATVYVDQMQLRQ